MTQKPPIAGAMRGRFDTLPKLVRSLDDALPPFDRLPRDRFSLRRRDVSMLLILPQHFVGIVERVAHRPHDRSHRDSLGEQIHDSFRGIARWRSFRPS